MHDCRLLGERIAGVDTMDEDTLERHAAECPSCRQQLAAHRELRRTFRALAQPSLSPRFNRQLAALLDAETRRHSGHRQRLLLMQAYWLAASVASVCILLWTRWPTAAPSALVVSVLVTILAGSLLTLVILLRSLRTGLLDLILGTMHLLRR